MSDDMQFAVIGAVFGSALTLFIIVTWARSITRNQRQQIEQAGKMIAALERLAPKQETAMKPASAADDPIHEVLERKATSDRVDRVRGMLRDPDR